MAAAATAAPTGNTIAAPTSAPKRPAAKTKARGRPIPRKAAAHRRGERRGAKPARPAPVPATISTAEQRLELVADPVEPHAEPRVRAQQRERGQRRAGDHVDRVGGDRQSGSHGERPVAPEQGQRQRRQRRRPEHRHQHFRPLPRFERRRGQQDQGQVDDREPGKLDPDAPGCPAGDRDRQAQRQHPGQQAEPDHRPAPLRDHRHPGAERLDRGRVDIPLARGSAAPTSATGLAIPNQPRIVGATSVEST